MEVDAVVLVGAVSVLLLLLEIEVVNEVEVVFVPPSIGLPIRGGIESVVVGFGSESESDLFELILEGLEGLDCEYGFKDGTCKITARVGRR